MPEKHYAIIKGNDELKAIVNHRELVQIMSVFFNDHNYLPLTQKCARELRKELSKEVK